MDNRDLRDRLSCEMRKACEAKSAAADRRLERQINEILADFDNPCIPKYELRKKYRSSGPVLARVISRHRGIGAWEARKPPLGPQHRPK